MKSFLSVLLTLTILISITVVSPMISNAATADEPVGIKEISVKDYKIFSYDNNSFVWLNKYTGTDRDIVIPSSFDTPVAGIPVTGITDGCFAGMDITSVVIPDSITRIGAAFAYCDSISFVQIPDSVQQMSRTFFNCKSLSTVIHGKNASNLSTNVYPTTLKYIYLPADLSDFNPKVFAFDGKGNILENVGPTDIYYQGSKSQYNKTIGKTTPEKSYRKIHYNTDLSTPVGTTRIVSDDFKLDLANVNGNIESGEIALAAGTYEFNIHKGDIFRALNGNNVLGYGKTVNDNTTGSLSYNARYKSKTTLVASGGVYSFRFDKSTNKLTIKRTADLPEVYLKGNPDLSAFREAPINLILSRINGTNLSIGACSLPAAEYNFKLVKNGVEMGCETDTDFVASSPATVSENGSGNLKYSAGHETFTFIYNHDTNQVSCKSISDMDVEKSADTISVLGSGINLVLTDNNGQSSTATGTVRLQSGMYNFKLYNKGTPYAGNFVYYDNGFKNIKSTYNTPITLMASGGLYRFTYYKYSGAFNIQKI